MFVALQKHFKNEDLRKVRLARYIKRTMGNDKPMEAALNRAYHNESQVDIDIFTLPIISHKKRPGQIDGCEFCSTN